MGLKDILRKTWLFKKRTNIMLGTLGLGSTTYAWLRYDAEKRFNHPVVNEIVRVMERNQQLIELIGYPLGTRVSVRSIFDVEGKDANLYFIVAGPKGTVNVEAHAEFMTVSQISKQDSSNAESATFAGKYYLPDRDLFESVIDAKGDEEKLKDIKIDGDTKFWRLEAVFADLSGQYRIPIIQEDEEKILREKNQGQTGLPSKKSNTSAYIQTNSTERATGLDVWKEYQQRNFRDTVDSTTLSETEQEERRRFRMNQLYSKIGYVRGWMFLAIVLGGMGTFVFLAKNKRISVLNSQIHKESMEIIKKSTVAKQLFGASLRFSTSVRGSQIDKDAEFDIDIIGEKFNGIAKVKGNQKETGSWHIQSITLEQKDNKGQLTQTKKII